MMLLWIILFCLLGSVLSAGLAGVVLLLRGRTLSLFTASLIPYAIGTLLGAAFFGMIPHALHELPSESVLPTILAGFVLFFLLERFTLWRHCHEPSCEVHHAAGELILIGDALHNFVDGVAIAVAFTGSFPLGVATSLAVIAHEIPQEVGDFAVLLESGYTKSRAFWFNLLSSAAALLGAVLTYFILPLFEWTVPYLLSLSAASFIYIALADLIPGRRSSAGGFRGMVREILFIALGIGTILLFHMHGQH